jgi:F0F1-type ATP synthase membrane subunit c/vacuolar-type H+-ATPase subunit K
VQLERVSVELRPRGGWEALDLGFQMARTWWRPVWGVWLAVYLPLAALLHAAFADRLWVAVLILWWLKPLLDRFVLHVVSRAVFGAPPTVRETLAAWRDIVTPGALMGLTLFRIDLARSFMMPVWQLERQTGRAANARRSALAKRTRYYAVWLTVLCAHFEAVGLLSLGLLVDLLAPGAADAGFELRDLLRGGEGARWDWFDSLCYVAAVSAVEPLYVCGGFALYLNRRAILEGWDIELALRRLDERLRTAATAVAAAIAIGLAALVAPPPAVAADKSAKAEIREVLKAPEFQEYREGKVWRYRGEAKDRKPDELDVGFWSNLGLFLAEIWQALAWLAAGLAAVGLALVLRRWVSQWMERKPEAYRAPDALFGLSLAPESLPDDVAGAAAALVRAGRLREALSLLYRGALSVLVHRDHVPLAEGDTEGDCVRAARKALPQAAGDYFARLVESWSSAAYAGRLPDARGAESLCREWSPHFAPRTAGVA